MPILMLQFLKISEFAKEHWKAIFAVTCFLLFSIGIYNHGYNNGKRTLQERWDKANAEAQIEAALTERRDSLIGNKIGGEYASKVKNVDDSFFAALASLHQPASYNLPSASDSPCKPDAATNADRVHKANARLKLAREAEINTQKLIALQEWVKEVK